jgi:hypothetical protein
VTTLTNEQVAGLVLVYVLIIFLGWLFTRNQKDRDHDAF